MPRGRPKKQKQVVANHDHTDLFKLITELIGRDLSDEESQSVVKSCFSFIKDNYSPSQIYDDEVLKEDVLNNGIVSKKDFYNDEEDEDEGLNDPEDTSDYYYRRNDL